VSALDVLVAVAGSGLAGGATSHAPSALQWALLSLAAVVAVWALFVAVLYAAGRGRAARALARLIPDLVVLFKRLLADPRVPRRAKVALGLGIGYLALPFDLVPDFIPVVGALDDVVVVALVLRYALGSAGPDLVAELWPGPAESLRVVLALAGDQRRRLHDLAWVVLFGALLPMVVFVLLAEDVWEHQVVDWDTSALHAMERIQNDALTVVMKVVTVAGSAPVVGSAAVIIIVWLALKHRRREAVFTFVAVAGAGTLNVLLKGLFGRPRPEVFPHLVQESSSSFPSGHTMSAMAFAATVIVLCWPTRWRWPVATGATAYAFAVGVSRVYLGVHYPSDVIAGWAVTIAWVTIAWLLVLSRTGDEADDAREDAEPADDGIVPAPADDTTLSPESP